jgi:pyruvate,water dikinase
VTDAVFFADATAADALRLGGKGAELARLFAAGLPVPDGFVVRAGGDPESARAAYAKLGDGTVAVRSSALGEDGAETSFAGQQSTFLGVSGADAVVDAVRKCLASLHTDRAQAYRRKQNVGGEVAMAVVVQRLVDADTAGVMFTADPTDPLGSRLSIEASWGLGETVVSGRITPDRYTVSRATGEVLSRVAGDKSVRVTATGDINVSPEQRYVLCLSDSQLSQLAGLAVRVEASAGGTRRDVEWAFAGGELFLLQSRPVTAMTAVGREQLRRNAIDQLRSASGVGDTAWVRYSLSEVLPEPTPMTWALVHRLVSADGGFGTANRDLGATPDSAAGTAFDLVAGRPMANLARMPFLQFARPPIEYPITAYRLDPKLALNPRPVFKSPGLWHLPAALWRLARMASIARRESATFAERYTTEIAPPFRAAARAALAEDWSTHAGDTLVTLLHAWTEKTFVGFARDSLKCTIFADLSWTTLAAMLTPKLGEAGARAALTGFATGAKPPAGSDLAAALRRLTEGTSDRMSFLKEFGHRGPNEMELAAPRWSEDPAGLPNPAAKPADDFTDLAARLSALGTSPPVADDGFAALADEAKLSGTFRSQARAWATRLRDYTGLREAAKNDLILGVAVMRKALTTMAARHGIGADIFDLEPYELPRLIAGESFTATVAGRKRRRRDLLTLEVPAVLFSDDLDAIGRPLPPPDDATTFTGLGLSAGRATAPAFVTTDPSTAPPDGPFVLVAPSTDPAWVPLFARAKGLILETGGVLSHGAIVAREFGLPAVGGLPGILRQLASGDEVTVDGTQGIVAVVRSASSK